MCASAFAAVKLGGVGLGIKRAHDKATGDEPIFGNNNRRKRQLRPKPKYQEPRRTYTEDYKPTYHNDNDGNFSMG